MIMKFNRLWVLCALVCLISACGSDSRPSQPSLTGFENSNLSHFTATAYTTCAQSKTGQLKCLGDGTSYNFANGLNDYIGDDAEETGAGIGAAQLGDEPIQYAMANVYFGCALYNSGVVKCWGDKLYLGLDDPASDSSDHVGDVAAELGNNLPVINLGANLTAKQISLGDSHACAVLSNDRVKCWGNNGSGRLGYGDENTRGDNAGEMGENLGFVDLGDDAQGNPYGVKSVVAGYNRTCAILSNNGLKCWGANGYGQAGYGHRDAIGDDADEMGANLPFVDLGTGRSAKQVFNYYVHTCVILDNDDLKCWGSNKQGEVGIASGDENVGDNLPITKEMMCHNGSEQLIYERTDIETSEACEYGGIVLDTANDTNGNGVIDDGEALMARTYCHAHDMNALLQVNALPTGEDMHCGLVGGYEIVIDFDNDHDGEMSDGTQNFMGDALPVVDFGSSSAVVDVALGDDHSCALLADTTLKCWGDNGEAQLGLDSSITEYSSGANETIAAQAEVDLGDGLYAVAITGGYDFTCALLNNDQVKCWGYDNDYATLGVPEYLDEYIGDGDPEPEMGNALKPVVLFE